MRPRAGGPAAAAGDLSSTSPTRAPPTCAATGRRSGCAQAEPLDQPAAEAPRRPTSGPSRTARRDRPGRRHRPRLDTLFPQRIHGKLFITLGATNGSCSATVVKSFRANLILTAGHCVFDAPAAGAARFWATNVAFVPGYRNGSAPFGVIPAIELRAPQSWMHEGDIAFDLGAVNLAPGAGGEIQNWLGARGITFNRPRQEVQEQPLPDLRLSGRARPLYDGQSLILCNSQFLGFEAFSGSVGAGPCHQQQGSQRRRLGAQGHRQLGRQPRRLRHPQRRLRAHVGTYFGDTAYKLWDAAAGTVPKGKRKQRMQEVQEAAARRTGRSASKAQTYEPVGARPRAFDQRLAASARLTLGVFACRGRPSASRASAVDVSRLGTLAVLRCAASPSTRRRLATALELAWPRPWHQAARHARSTGALSPFRRPSLAVDCRPAARPESRRKWKPSGSTSAPTCQPSHSAAEVSR